MNQWQNQLLTTTRISAMNIESFGKKFSENLLSVSNNPLIKSKTLSKGFIEDDTNFCCVENLYNIHKEDINSILLLNHEGLIIKRYPFWKDSSQITSHCLWGISEERFSKEGEISVSKVYVNQAGKPAFSISCPIFYNNRFTGIVRWMIEMTKVSNKYIDTISVGTNGYMWLVDEEKVIRAHHDPTFVGLKINMMLKDMEATAKISGYNSNKSIKYIHETQAFFDKMEQNDEGFGNIIDIAHNVYSLAVFKKVKLANKEWTLIMNIPYSEIVAPVNKNATKNILFVLFFSIVLSIIFSIMYQFQKKRVQLEKEALYLKQIAETAEALKEERQKRLTAQIDGQELERNRVSRELHDGLGQHLLAAKVKLEELYSVVPLQLKENLDYIRNLFLSTIEEAKRISNNLMPFTLEELGIETALKNLCHEFQENYNVKLDFVAHGVSENLTSKQKRYIYRISQEALNNVYKHSKATEVNVQLLGNEEQLTLVIQDNGVGFDSQSNNHKGNGLHNILDRAQILSAQFNVESQINEGTTITLKIPLK